MTISLSLLLPVRITEEKFANFKRYFQSIVDFAYDVKNIEVIVKFDDDQNLNEAIEIIENYKKNHSLNIKYIISPRGRGYEDSCAFYTTQMIFLCDPQSKLFSANSIDLKFIKKDFDKILLDVSNNHEDGIFVIHPTAKLCFKTDVTDINRSVQHVECFPFWSRKWIEIQGNFGYNSSSDGYTGLVEYFLFNEWGIDKRIGLNEKLIEETDCGEVNSKYWQGPRRKSMESHLSSQSVAFARQAARNLALNIANSWKKDGYYNYLIQACLNNYDKNLLLERENASIKHEFSVIGRKNLKPITKKHRLKRYILRTIIPSDIFL